jgi:charged multivesicular body protein 4
MKRKKQYEAQIEKISGTKMTIEEQVMTIEGASVTFEALNAMKLGADTMKGIHKSM